MLWWPYSLMAMGHQCLADTHTRAHAQRLRATPRSPAPQSPEVGRSLRTQPPMCRPQPGHTSVTAAARRSPLCS